MDSEDWMYFVAIVLVAAGAGCWHIGAALVCAGAMLAVGPLLSMIRGGTPKGPEE